MLHSINSSCDTICGSVSPCSQGDCWRSEDVKALKHPEFSKEKVQIKRSCSLGNILEEGTDLSGEDMLKNNDYDHGFPLDFFIDWNMKGGRDPFDDNISTDFVLNEHDQKNRHNQEKENESIKSFDLFMDPVHHESSIDVIKQSDLNWSAGIGHKDVDYIFATRQPSRKIPQLARSHSLINIRASMAESTENGRSHGRMFRRSRSFSGLSKLNELEDYGQPIRGAIAEKTIIASCSNWSKHTDANSSFLSYHDRIEGGLSLLRNDLVLDHDINDEVKTPEGNDVCIKENCQGNAAHCNEDQLTTEEFSMKRVEHWISQIGIHGDLIVEEPRENSTSVSDVDSTVLCGVDSSKTEGSVRQAMGVASNYISSLTPASSSAHLAKLGLVVIPMLSPFTGLRVLNLSGNAIVRITPGSLPKGLHLLNLSNNFISTIEGLRDATRLRVLNVSCNRISRLGHGLASCSSLKELYLAGNKISEVEGLHRLLKLNILDLRFNKISTVKSLAQLAANYGSLIAINLEGNPAQRNVGDEQLKKFLLGLLPNLVYYNKSAIRTGLKEASDRFSRAIVSPPFDRGIRAEHKLPPRGSHGSGLHQFASSHGAQVLSPSKLPKSLHPSSSSKQAYRHVDSGKNHLGLNAMKRSRSTDALRSYPKC